MSSMIESEVEISKENQRPVTTTLRNIATLFSMFAATAAISLLTTLSWVA